MRLEGDELAGIVDLFGALSRAELRTAGEELAFRRGVDFDATAHTESVQAAVREYRLVEVELESIDVDEGLVVGPTAFPTVPEHGMDLPHIIDISERAVDRESVGHQTEQRMREEAAQAVVDGEGSRVETLLDVSYDLEAWAPVDVADIRTRLTAALDGT